MGGVLLPILGPLQNTIREKDTWKVRMDTFKLLSRYFQEDDDLIALVDFYFRRWTNFPEYEMLRKD